MSTYTDIKIFSKFALVFFFSIFYSGFQLNRNVIFKSFLSLLIFIYPFIFGPASARSFKIGVVGNNWLVG